MPPTNRAGASNYDPTGPAKTGGASGISPNPANNTTSDLTEQDVPLPISSYPTGGLFTEFGRKLLNAGVDLHGSILDRFEANPTVGIMPGHTYNLGAFAPAVDLDLQRLIDLPGGNLHIEVTVFGLRSDIPQIALQTGGFITGAQTTPAVSGVPVSLSVFTYEQKLLNNKLSIEFGRSNPVRYFELSNSIDPFSYFPATLSVNADINSPRFPTWSGRVTYKVTPTFALQGAAFEDNFPKSANTPDAFGIRGAAGASLWSSLEYRTEFSSAAYPQNAEIGFEYDTRHGRNNVPGTAVAYNGRDAATDYHGGGVIFGQGQQVVWRGQRVERGPPANIAVYGQIDAGVNKPQPFDFDSLVGVNLTGFIPGRPFDVLEFETRYQRMSQIEANFESRLRNIFAGLGPRQPRDAYQFELVGNIQATPWFQLRPFSEAFINPDSYYGAFQNRRAQSGFEFGVFGRILFGPLLGTSTKPF